jgi:hypothetical protein
LIALSGRLIYITILAQTLNIVFMKRNLAIFGLFLGLVFPILGLLTMYLIKFSSVPLNVFFQNLISDPKVAGGILSLSLIANLIPFMYYTNKRLDLTAKGVLIATMLYAVVIILLKFVW